VQALQRANAPVRRVNRCQRRLGSAFKLVVQGLISNGMSLLGNPFRKSIWRGLAVGTVQGRPECPNLMRGFWDTSPCQCGRHAERQFRRDDNLEESGLRDSSEYLSWGTDPRKAPMSGALHRSRLRLCCSSALTDLLLDLRQILPCLLARPD